MNDRRSRAASPCLVARNKTQYLRYVLFQCLNSCLNPGYCLFMLEETECKSRDC